MPVDDHPSSILQITTFKPNLRLAFINSIRQAHLASSVAFRSQLRNISAQRLVTAGQSQLSGWSDETGNDSEPSIERMTLVERSGLIFNSMRAQSFSDLVNSSE